MTDEQFQDFLEAALKRVSKAPDADADAIARVLARLSPLPRQKRPFWRLPGVLLDWQFAPAWPRVAAFAGCLALGFAIGIAGVDRRIDRANASYSIASNDDLGAIVSAPEALTGAQP
jgi:hypothetical protein